MLFGTNSKLALRRSLTCPVWRSIYRQGARPIFWCAKSSRRTNSGLWQAVTWPRLAIPLNC